MGKSNLLTVILKLVRMIDRADISIFRILPKKFKRQFVRSILRCFGSFGPDVLKINGLALRIPRNLAYVYQSHQYEYGTQTIIKKYLESGMVALDVGANIGYLTLLMASLVGQHGKVFAVEPDQGNLNFLYENIRSNALTQVQVFACAAGNERAIRDLYCSNSGLLQTLYSRNNSQTESVKIQQFPLDELLQEKHVDFAKIDVEGAEMEVLSGMETILRSNPQLQMIIEWNPPALLRAGHNPQELLEFLINSAFRIHSIDETTGNLTELNCQAQLPTTRRYVNLFARPVNLA